MNQIQQDIINLIPVYLYYSDGNPVKYMRDQGFTHKIKIRYFVGLHQKMKELFETFNIDLQIHNKPQSNNDIEKVQLYQFNKIMEFDNTEGFYEKCGLFTIVTNSKHNRETLSEFLYDEINKLYSGTTLNHTKLSSSISSKYLFHIKMTVLLVIMVLILNIKSIYYH